MDAEKRFFTAEEAAWTALEAGKVSRAIRAYDPALMLVEVLFENGGEGAAHTHPHTQATYCLEGEFDFTLGMDTRRLRPGDSVLIPPGVNHGCRLLSARGRLLDTFAPYRADFL